MHSTPYRWMIDVVDHMHSYRPSTGAVPSRSMPSPSLVLLKQDSSSAAQSNPTAAYIPSDAVGTQPGRRSMRACITTMSAPRAQRFRKQAIGSGKSPVLKRRGVDVACSSPMIARARIRQIGVRGSGAWIHHCSQQLTYHLTCVGLTQHSYGVVSRRVRLRRLIKTQARLITSSSVPVMIVLAVVLPIP